MRKIAILILFLAAFLYPAAARGWQEVGPWIDFEALTNCGIYAKAGETLTLQGERIELYARGYGAGVRPKKITFIFLTDKEFKDPVGVVESPDLRNTIPEDESQNQYAGFHARVLIDDKLNKYSKVIAVLTLENNKSYASKPIYLKQ